MKITAITLYQVKPRWQFIAIDTDEGITGWGEAVLEGRAQTVAAAVNELKDYLIGKNPLDINRHWQIMYSSAFYRGGPILMSAIAGIDQALWDIKGKWLNQPVYELLGGKIRDKMKTYTWVGGDDPNDEIEQIQSLIKQGWNTFKLNGSGALKFVDSHQTVDNIISRISQIRSTFGNTIDFGLDFHGRVSLPMAKVLLKELEPFRPLFIEEPVLPEHSDAYQQLTNISSIPLAGGERLYSRYDFKTLLTTHSVNIIQPDLSHAGGITECYKIASMAEAYNVGFAPHCPLGPIALSACLTIDFVVQNAVLQEQSMGIHYNKGADLLDYVKNPQDFMITNSYIKPLAKLGLGVDINREKLIEESKNPQNWYPPIWTHDDGSFAEW